MGHEAQRRMMASKAMLVGSSGLGIKIAKKCILAGISSLEIVDPLAPTSYDLGGIFYLPTTPTAAEEPSSRANLCKEQLS